MNDELLGKYLAGEALPEEATVVEDWLAQSPENREAFERLSALWNAAAGTKYQPADKKTAWQDLRKQLPASAAQQQGRSGKWIGIVLVAIVVTAIVVLLLRKKSGHDEPLSTTALLSTSTEILRHDLGNGGSIVLNSHSVLQTADGSNDQTNFVLNEGQVYIVAPSNAMLKVTAGKLTIEGKEAAFCIGMDKGSGNAMIWGSKGTTIVHAGKSSRMLPSGTKLKWDAAGEKWSIDTTYPVNEIAYATRIFDFQDERLADIMRQLGKAYDFSARFVNPELSNCRMSGSFENQSLKYVMDIIATTLQIEYKIEGNVVVINGKECE